MATVKDLAMKMIPVLIRWAQGAWDKPHYYSDLSKAVGYNSSRIGGVLGEIQDIINNLAKDHGRKIPTLNGLVQNKKKGLPSDGFDYVVKDYSGLSDDSKKGEVAKLNFIAHKFDWSLVLKELNLSPARIIDDEEIKKIQKGVFGKGGEGAEHKLLKEYIYEHPKKVSLDKPIEAVMEYCLMSGDKLDVFFKYANKHIAIEVKPSNAPEEDVRRGIFQCVKYKSVMDAERVVYADNYDNEVLLVLGGLISDVNKQIALDLGVRYIENFKIK